MSDGTGAALWFTGTADKLGFYHSGGPSVDIAGVLRDPSSYYHVVLVVDTTQAQTAHSLSDSRVRIYINGVQQTTSGTLPTQNTDLTINQAVQHRISGTTNSNYYFNGYLTEINFLDGQVPTTTTRTVNGVTENILSQLGEFSSSTGVWTPKAWNGTYGTNGFYLPFKTASQWSGYFDGTGDSLTYTSTVAIGSGDFTLEAWVYLTATPSVNGWVYGARSGSNTSGYLFFDSSRRPCFQGDTTAFLTSSTAVTLNTWNHIAVVRQGSATGNLKLYLNGTQVASVGTTNNFSYTGTQYIGATSGGSPYNITGYISNLRIVPGTAVYTSAFTPPTSQLTAITNTSLLTCQSSTFVDNSTNAFTITANGDSRTQQFSPFTLDVTDDHSGQGNHWQPNNLDLRTTGVGADILVDSPTAYGTDTGVGGEVRGNYCTMNPLQYSSTYVTLTNGNLNVTGSSGADAGGAFATSRVNSGKWYWEATIVAVSGTYPFIGFAVNTSGTQYQGGARIGTAGTPAIVSPESFIALNGSPSGTSFTTNDILQFALDMDNGKMWIGKNGTWMNSGVPASGTGNMFSISDRTQFVSPYIFSYNSSQVAYNFGQRAFAYTAPSGFKAFCTQNFTTPTIGATSATRANDYFDVVTYTGTGSTRSITSLEFQPDFTWIKPRSAADHHILYDAVRGIRKQLYTNLTNAEETETQGLSAFLSNGFTLGGAHTVRGQTNDSGVTYASWNWKANGAGSTNSNGTAKSSSVTVDSSTDTVTWNSHGMSDGQKIGFFAATMPVGLSAGTLYYVRDAATNTFKVAASSGGAAIDITTNGTTVTAHTTLTSTVSASSSSGFSVVTYTGTGANTTVEHGIGTAPTFIIVKRRNSAVGWPCLVKAANNGNGQNGRLNLNETANYADNVEFWNNTSPTSNVFSVGIHATTNASGGTYVAYCFAPVAGYSAFGSYVGNAAADGPFIYTGFRPEYVLIKASTSTGDWIIEDAVRSPYNVSTNYLVANTTGTETTGQLIDFLSNGFKIRVAVSSAINGSGTTYIYAAFAENPFKYSLAR